MEIDTLHRGKIVIKGGYATTSETGCTRSSSSRNGAWDRRVSHILRGADEAGIPMTEIAGHVRVRTSVLVKPIQKMEPRGQKS